MKQWRVRLRPRAVVIDLVLYDLQVVLVIDVCLLHLVSPIQALFLLEDRTVISFASTPFLSMMETANRSNEWDLGTQIEANSIWLPHKCL